MNSQTYKVVPMACLGLGLAAASLLVPLSDAQSVEVSRPAQPAITLDPPTGSELQSHIYDANGNVLPEAPANFRRLGEANVGQPADLRTLSLRFAETTTVTGIKSTPEFRVEPGGSCESGNTYQKGTSCTVLVRFTPNGPGNRLGKLTVTTNVSASPMAFGLGGYGYSPIVSFIPSIIATVPGSYPSNVGLLSGAANLTIDGGDTLWVADTTNGLIRQMDGSGTFRTFASGYTGVSSVAVDTFGQAYFDVSSTGKMYEIYDYGPVVQVSGTGTGSCPASTPCTLSSEALGTPGEMSMDPYNHLFFVDSHSGAAFSTVQPIPANLIFLYDPFPYQQSPSAAMAVDSGDNLYSLWANGGVCEIVQQSLYNAENSNVSFNKVVGGHTCGFAGDGGLAGNAEIGAKVNQIAFDAAGNMYFSDTANQRIRRVDYTTGTIRTIAGNGTAGYTGDGTGATAATLSTPTGVGVDSQGQVYIISTATSPNQVIRKVTTTGIRNMGNVSKGVQSPASILTVTNTGNSTLVLTNTTITGTNAADFAVDPNTTSCNRAAGSTLGSGQTCQIGFTCTPSGTGTRTATFTMLDNTVASANTVSLLCNGTLPTPAMTITSPANGASFTSGTAVTFSVKVGAGLTPTPTGTVQFKVDGANFGSPVTLSSGAASTSVTGLTQTSHTLSATYSGDASYSAAGPVSVSIVVTAVKVGSFVTLSQTANAATACATPQFAASVSGRSGPVPTGQVQLLDGATAIASGTLSGGTVSLSPHPLTPGTHRLIASYSGDAAHLPSVSPAMVDVVAPSSPCTGPVNGGALHSPVN